MRDSRFVKTYATFARRLLLAAVVFCGGDALAAAQSSADPAVSLALEFLSSRAGKAAVAAAPPETYAAKQVTIGADGTPHVHLDRYYRGLRVTGADLIVHLRAGRPWASTSAVTPVDLSVEPSVSAARAKRIARMNYPGSADGLSTKAQLQISFDRPADRYRLVWRVATHARNAGLLASRFGFVIDATSGEVLEVTDSVRTQGASTGTGKTTLFGAVPVDSFELSPTSFVLLNVAVPEPDVDPAFSVRLYPPGPNVPPPPPDKTKTAKSTNDVWGNGRASNRNTYAAEAMYSATAAIDYFEKKWGRSGSEAAVVHFLDAAGTLPPYQIGPWNAAWETTCNCILITDDYQFPGHGGTTHAPTSVDAVGHEFTHGVFSIVPGFDYKLESGGLDEANADIFAAMIEFDRNAPNEPGDYINPGTLNAPANLVRNMARPSLDGQSYDCWTFALGNLNPHYSAGPALHFFYLLAQGSRDGAGTTTSPTCRRGDSKVAKGADVLAGIGRDTAISIWHAAVSNYLVSDSNYLDARGATLQAAVDAFGAGSREYFAVKQAWNAVNVDGTVYTADFNAGRLPKEIAWNGLGEANIVPVAGYGAYGVPFDLRGGPAKFEGSMLQLCGPSSTGGGIGNSGIRLLLTDLPPHKYLQVDFFLAAIDSLDGNLIPGSTPTPDFFNVYVDPLAPQFLPYFSETFTNEVPPASQSYVATPYGLLADKLQIAFHEGPLYADSAYYMGADERLTNIPHTASSVDIRMQLGGAGIQDCSDFESFGIENLRISVSNFHDVAYPPSAP